MRIPIAAGCLALLLPACVTPGPEPRVADSGQIAALEDARHDPNGALAALTRDPNEGTRRRAVRALGRMPGPVSEALLRALSDPSTGVRADAAFALGQQGDVRHEDALVRALREETSAEVRAELVTALGWLDEANAGTRRHALRLDDPDPVVRRAAATVAQRWATQGEGVDAQEALHIDGALIRAAREDGDGEVRWRALFALRRRKSELARALFIERVTLIRSPAPARSPDTVRSPDTNVPLTERLFATMGLADLEGITADEGSARALRQALGDESWRVRCEALRGLARQSSAATTHAILIATGDPVLHVRREAATALGGVTVQEGSEQIEVVLRRLTRDSSPSVRAAAIEALARNAPESAQQWILRLLVDPDPIVRGGSASGLAHMSASFALAPIRTAVDDEDPYVRQRAMEALTAHIGSARELTRELLAHEDNGVRLAAANALGEAPQTEDLPDLLRAFRETSGDIADEVAFACISAAQKLEGPLADELLLAARDHSNPFLRAAAQKASDAGAGTHMGALFRAGELPPQPDPEYLQGSLHATIVTSKGDLVCELYPADAPLHVHNFVELAERGFYDGLRFHRVVPDFVIQGGDARGDGNGGTTFRGEPLRQEFNRHTYARGALGTPRWADPESGGGQIFLTHRPTPHLDGKYTLFGQLIEGFDVLDAVDVGDRILSVEIKGPESSLP